MQYMGPPRPGSLLNRPRGDKCSKQGSRLKLTVVRRIWAASVDLGCQTRANGNFRACGIWPTDGRFYATYI